MKTLTLKRLFLMTLLGLLFHSTFMVAVPGSTVPPDSDRRRVKIWVKSFIPFHRVDVPFGPCFSGDNRDFSEAVDAPCRTHQEIEFEVTPLRVLNQDAHTGKTHQVNCKDNKILHTGQAKKDGLRTAAISGAGQQVSIKMGLIASNPLVRFAPSIDLDITLNFDWPNSQVTLAGFHDGYPAFEIYMSLDGGKPIKLYQFRTSGNGIWDHSKLGPPMDVTIKPVTSSFRSSGS